MRAGSSTLSHKGEAKHAESTLKNPARSPEVLNLLVKLISLSLSLGLHSTSLFLAERYNCLCPQKEEAVFYYALCLLRSGESRQSLELLKNSIVDISSSNFGGFNSGAGSTRVTRKPACEASVRCAWVFAEASINMERPNEGAECLKNAHIQYGSQSSWKLNIPEQAAFPAESSIYSNLTINLALAKLATQANKPEAAIKNYTEALRIAWWCWEAYEGLCALGKAPDADTVFASLVVPAVPEPPPVANPDTAGKKPSFGPSSVSMQFARTNSQDPQLKDSQISSPVLTNPTTTPGLLYQTSYHNQQAHYTQPPFDPALASKPTGQEASAYGTFGSESVAPRHATTPSESQGAAFKFGEASHIADGNESVYEGIHPASGMSISIDDVNNDSSFFGSGRAGTNGIEMPGGLFGFARHKNAAFDGAKKNASSALFGSGLLFHPNANASSSKTTTPVTVPVKSSGSFFTPVARPPSVISTLFNNTGPSQRGVDVVRAAPAVKRSRHEVDVDDSLPSFQFRNTAFGAEDFRPSSPNGYRIPSESREQAASGAQSAFESNGKRNGTRDSSCNEDEEAHGDDLRAPLAKYDHTAPGAPRKGTAANLNVAMAAAGGRRSNRLNSQPATLSQTSGKQAQESQVSDLLHADRVTSNPSRRKRSKAGPTDYEDSGPNLLDRHTHSDAATSPVSNLTSSSPPATVAYLEPIPSAASTISSTPMVTTYSSSSTAPAASANGFSHRQQSSAHTSTYRTQLEASRNAIAENWLRSIYRTFGKATAALSRFDCLSCIKAVLSLPNEQRRSSRAILLLGKAHFESLNYAKAEQAFLSARSVAPYSTTGMEIYSTLLWHLHKPTELSFLAQELMAVSPTEPTAWIATGNVFSHLEDHPNALKCFKRAIQSNPSFKYAYTLAGHECVTMEEWDTALGFFREAIKLDPRHYNAWFGLGNVYMKTGKYRLAEYHFRKAVDINSSNAMLVCCVGTVLEKMGQKKEALELYERGCLLAPKSPAVRFKRVRMLMELRQWDSALRDLLIVRDLAPDEFNVHFLLGKLYGAMGDKTNMTRSLTFAQDLEPRAAGRIREIIERAGAASEEEEEEEEEEGNDGNLTPE